MIEHVPFNPYKKWIYIYTYVVYEKFSRPNLSLEEAYNIQSNMVKFIIKM